MYNLQEMLQTAIAMATARGTFEALPRGDRF
jgi:hypothetical protein